MAFLDILFPTGISHGAVGGPHGRSKVTQRDSGHETRNQAWNVGLGRWDVAHGVKTQAQLDELQVFIMVAEFRRHTWRYQDWSDMAVAVSGFKAGRLGAAAIGTGMPTYQLVKRYANAVGSKDVNIVLPKNNAAFIARRNASPITVGGGAGQIGVDFASGIVTFVADASRAITGHTPGASHQFTTATDIASLAIGEKVYLTGITGTAAAVLNAIAHTISNKTGAGPFTWTLGTNTAGLTASGGTAFEYPQASDALTWEGEHDKLCRFNTDSLLARIDGFNNYSWGQIPVWEVRSK